MMSNWRWQSPAGERIAWSAIVNSIRAGNDCHGPWIGFQSGTAALAAALAFGRQKLGDATSVALPAYSCPSLIAAALHVGLEPFFLDLEPTGLSPSATQYARALAGRCRMAVLVDLFGVRAPVDELLAASKVTARWLVHDRAQSLVAPGFDPGSRADVVIASLGRGKPVSLLSGGAASCAAHVEFLHFARSTYPTTGWHYPKAMLKAVLYNLALNPVVYGFVARMPGLGLGETRLVRLNNVERLPETWLEAAACQAAIASGAESSRRNRSVTMLEIAQEAGYYVPASAQSAARGIGLNRLPLLCRTATQAESLLQRGRRLGLSAMYRRTLPEFAGRSPEETAREFPNAYDVSRRLVTLPTHSRVSAGDLALIRRMLDDCR
jgi:dTDP-4-amino-4,6-dideoxygalactose transaminase